MRIDIQREGVHENNGTDDNNGNNYDVSGIKLEKEIFCLTFWTQISKDNRNSADLMAKTDQFRLHFLCDFPLENTGNVAWGLDHTELSKNMQFWLKRPNKRVF